MLALLSNHSSNRTLLFGYVEDCLQGFRRLAGLQENMRSDLEECLCTWVLLLPGSLKLTMVT